MQIVTALNTQYITMEQSEQLIKLLQIITGIKGSCGQYAILSHIEHGNLEV